jgi:hypothetical protein
VQPTPYRRWAVEIETPSAGTGAGLSHPHWSWILSQPQSGKGPKCISPLWAIHDRLDRNEQRKGELLPKELLHHRRPLIKVKAWGWGTQGTLGLYQGITNRRRRGESTRLIAEREEGEGGPLGWAARCRRPVRPPTITQIFSTRRLGLLCFATGPSSETSGQTEHAPS